MKVVCASDFHGMLPSPASVPECDLLVLAGDLSIGSYAWWEDEFKPWLRDVPAEEIVGVAGNFDVLATAESGREYLRSLPWHFLHDETEEVAGLLVHGAPWASEHHGWPFCEPEDFLETRWDLIDPKTEVLVVHGPPKGVFDQVSNPYPNEDPSGHVGSPSLFKKITELADNELKLAVWGHIHEARGVREIPGLTLVNAACALGKPLVEVEIGNHAYNKEN